MKGMCSENNCKSVVYRRGLCRRHWEGLRARERQEEQSRIEEARREAERKTAWREYLPPTVYTPQDELDARARCCGDREREIFRRGRKWKGE